LIIGATAQRKRTSGTGCGYRESEQSWKEILLDLKARGLEKGPSCAVGDGAMGFWSVLQVYGKTRPWTSGCIKLVMSQTDAQR